MTAQSPLSGRTLVVSGGSRGIGLAIAVGAAEQGANVVLLAKTAEPHPKLPGTVHTAVADVEAAGGKAVPVVGDVRKEEDVQRAVDAAVEHFGGVDIVVNNASAIATEPTEALSTKKFDLMMDINVRGTFLLTRAALPHLRKAAATPAGAHVITLAPPLNLNPRWLGAHPSYTLSKYGMTLLSLGWAAEYADSGIGFACLWPQTYIATAAVANAPGFKDALDRSRDPRIMADAAVQILSRPAAEVNGQCFIDAEVLAAAGETDFSRYGGGENPILDIFVDES
ncbi:short chain dehydrogenase family protein [Mycolicibacterium hassiacum DSM 44199]|jgi:NAD(P)-dependent dehydrogenase (short-subunit alcohol dehydrogenase family)|uniref:Short chain dehydrogenase family protein n=1 Tax=Mycolicibacterium hassiacum (strain DSM 44199 / CIP 105218 / JCM 12690 / 3849) TaxID=1122247 RepID=K5BD45_MYCHD|nr:NAD(P)-dependent oxidoreductase [Mycolicibacterium hassiacum]EKF25665.1 short chain dehydrogenase family protein [Mycolicibacterium hassiacum DSM 44199]MBX5486242.1 NAD(P)-dependent oxidoreductase [Mycolicibacterium hassiacum]MDA4084582.1 short-chain dehydrogenase [Mycolicibacterium hassiacum DSM 44199]VCT90938.1 Glucose 1-dehydrogenase 2 [Mycolicibacterium hassiacum DSM 44199]